jgi:cardiolipin synthase
VEKRVEGHYPLSPEVRRLAQQAFCRAGGAALVGGNSVQLLIDAEANYAAWLAALRAARCDVLLENYIIRDDAVGREFLDALVERAQAGIRVFVAYDWLGCLGQSKAHFWRPLIDAGGEVRGYNPFRFGSPFGWINRDHRKLLMIDREVAFVGGICISAKWLGEKSRGIPAWRDTAVAVRGPAVLEFEHAFADTWAQLGTPLPASSLPAPSEQGATDVRVVATQPETAGMFRLDQLIAALAQRSLWISDAYFVGLAPYVQALLAAARDGVDVRLLVPGASDLPVVRTMSRSGYRPLLEAGVRVFEWNGSMMHAKTAVADGRWARVGSSNLNIASWIGNCELDVAVEDAAFAKCMEDQFLRDLENTTEIVLRAKRMRRDPPPAGTRRSGGSAGRAAASALRLAHSVGSVLGNRRVLDQGETSALPWFVAAAVAIAVTGLIWPRVLAWPLAIVAAWIGCGLLVRYLEIRRASRAARNASVKTAPAPTEVDRTKA